MHSTRTRSQDRQRSGELPGMRWAFIRLLLELQHLHTELQLSEQQRRRQKLYWRLVT